MFCPSCGRGCQEGLRFCNGCGTNLEIVKQALVTGMPAMQTPAPIPPPEALMQMYQDRQRLKKIGLILLGACPMWGATMAIISEILRNLNWTLSRVVAEMAGFAGVFFIAGIMVLIYMRAMYKIKDNPQFVILQQSPMAQPIAQSLIQPIAASLPAAQPLNQPLPNQQPLAMNQVPQTPMANIDLPPGRPLFADRVNNQTAPQNNLPGTELYDSYQVAPPSVTEHTTSKLKPPPSSPKI